MPIAAKAKLTLGIAILFVAVLIGTLPIVSGYLTKKAMLRIVQQFNESSAIKLLITSYNQRWFSADTVLSLKSDNPKLQEDILKHFSFHIHLDNGPIIKNPMTGHFTIGLARYNLILKIIRDPFNQEVDTHIRSTGYVSKNSINGSIDFLPGWSSADNQFSEKYRNGTFNLIMNPTNNKITIHSIINFDNLSFNGGESDSDKDKLIFDNVTLSGTADLGDSQILSYRTLLSVNKTHIDLLTLNDLSVDFKKSTSSNFEINHEAKMNIKNIITNNNTFSAKNIGFSFTGIGMKKDFLNDTKIFIKLHDMQNNQYLKWNLFDIPSSENVSVSELIQKIVHDFYNNTNFDFYIDDITAHSEGAPFQLKAFDYNYKLSQDSNHMFQSKLTINIGGTDITGIAQVNKLNILLLNKNINVAMLLKNLYSTIKKSYSLSLSDKERFEMIARNFIPDNFYFDSLFKLSLASLSGNHMGSAFSGENIKFDFAKNFHESYSDMAYYFSLDSIKFPQASLNQSEIGVYLKNMDASGMEKASNSLMSEELKNMSTRDRSDFIINKILPIIFTPRSTISSNLILNSNAGNVVFESNFVIKPQKISVFDNKNLADRLSGTASFQLSKEFMDNLAKFIANSMTEEFAKTNNRTLTPDEQKEAQKKYYLSNLNDIANTVKKGYLRQDINGYNVTLIYSDKKWSANGIPLKEQDTATNATSGSVDPSNGEIIEIVPASTSSQGTGNQNRSP